MNPTISAILLMAGKSERFCHSENKLLYQVHQKPLFMYSLDVLMNHPAIQHIYIPVSPDVSEEIQSIVYQNYDDEQVTFVEGGTTRFESVQKALQKVNTDFVLIHDAARPMIQIEDINHLIEQMQHYACGTLYHKVYDTVKDTTIGVKTIAREALKAVSTPQFFRSDLFSDIIHTDISPVEITDEIRLFEQQLPVAFVEESRPNLKVTTIEDIDLVTYYLTHRNQYKVGHSFDFHPIDTTRKLILGGVKFDTPWGLKGHSDADVVYHVVAESIMGALGLGDLGTLFPDTDDAFLNIDSSYFVEEVMKEVHLEGYVVENLDVIVYLEKPNLKEYKILMANHIKALTHASYVNVKATTLEKQGLIGSGLGVASEAVVLIRKKD